MASYPTSVKTFTTKNPGDTIQSADVDDLQDEVNAIEAGLLNGTANLNSSASTLNSLSVALGSTLNTLQVTGASTLATLQVTGGSTFTGNVTVNGTLTVSGGTPLLAAACQLTHSARQNISASAFTGLNWDTETSDAAGMHSTAVNSSRITFVASSGLYLVGGAVEWAVPSTGNFSCILRVMVNDATGQGATYVPALSASAFPQSIATLVRATSTTDYVTLQVFLGGSTGGVNGSTQYGYSFWAAKVV